MKTKIDINITQGKQQLAHADFNIIIDVIRAFTVSHYAFLKEIKEIILTNNIETAITLKKIYTPAITSGEINGYKISEFDYGNSPYDLYEAEISDKTLIQKTTNGVAVTLASLNADNIFITGYSNAKSTIRYIHKMIENMNKDSIKINIIASHPSGDEDIACAEYMKFLFLNNNQKQYKRKEEETLYRILESEAAKKFLDSNNKDFTPLDLVLCTINKKSDFAMKIHIENKLIKIKKVKNHELKPT
jgi:2-phosphosulfolactate phosphatase